MDWELASTPPDALDGPAGLDALQWSPAAVPGTVAGALGPDVDLDGRDWWFRTRFARGDAEALVLEGVATIADVYVNGEHVASSESMFEPIEIDLAGLGAGDAELAVCCRALGPRLGVRRRPRARWRTALVDAGNLRFHRTMLLGRAPGFAPGPPVVGPWRPVRLVPRRPPGVRLRARVDDNGDGVLSVASDRPVSIELAGATIDVDLDGIAELRVTRAERWWPHTHGEPALHDVRITAGDGAWHRRVGFRNLQWPAEWEQRGLSLRINGAAVFCRGALWTPGDLTAPHTSAEELRRTLETVRAAGMNMLRIPGIACYESDAFYDLCDELGILVWQDFMFANLDYPDADAEFMATVEREARHQLGRLAGRPSLAVLCGGSEVAQQVTMLGLDPALARGPIYTELLPRLVAEAEAAVPYVPGSPWGGTLPFRPDAGVANYYGVGAYRRPFSDARLSGVRFAGECLAFSNVPDDPPAHPPHHPDWKRGVPRDVGTGWDFEDVRDHYVGLLYGVDPVELRWTDVERYLELGRMATGEAMAEALGEWRRAGSPCAGALVLWLRDHRPGAGWGLLDHRGRPKVAYHHFRRAAAPVAVWTTDEGLGGVGVHIANDGPRTLSASLRIGLYRDGEVPAERVRVPVELPPRSAASHDLEALIGRFVDASWTYRFGPPAADVIVASLESGPEPGEGQLACAFRFPAGRPHTRESAAALGLEAELTDGGAGLRLRARRVVHGVRVHAAGAVPADDAFSLEPGIAREIALGGEPTGGVTVTALNLRDRVRAIS